MRQEIDVVSVEVIDDVFDAIVRGGMTPNRAYETLRRVVGEAAAKAGLARYEARDEQAFGRFRGNT